jgi:TetR/AcrR family acrAB operon transcriptional repressor
MARRTKEAAAETRANLLDAAEHLFLKQGVSGTSLAQIAQAAGATRGAIYWHFKDKADLFNAMMDRVTLPFETAVDELLNVDDPLQAMRDHAVETMDRLANDEQLQRVLSVAMLMVELVPEHSPIRAQHELTAERFTSRIAQAIEQRVEHGQLQLSATPEQISIGFHSLLSGLMYLWVLKPSFDLKSTCQTALNAYLRGAGLTVREEPC